MLDEELDNSFMTVFGCHLQRPVVIEMHVSVVLEQQRNHIRVALLSSTYQCILVADYISAMRDEE